MIRKALFFDIDGTLVSFQTHEIPTSTLHALQEAKALGMNIFIATGRPRILINNLDALQKNNLIDGYITMNGAYCFIGEKVLYKSAIPADDTHTLTHFCAERQIPCIVVGENDICACCPDERINHIFYEHLRVSTPIPYVPVEEAIRHKKVFQLTPFITVEEEAIIRPHIPHCEIGRWHPAFADVTALGNTKQQGMDVILQHFGLDLKNTVAFGDGGNDISMLQHAGIGIAMGNAQEHVKAAARYVTRTVDDDGIAHALQAIIKGKWS